jgi:copper transport protein
LNPKEVAIALSNPSSGIEPFERNAVQENQGTWRVDDLTLPVPGQWQVQIDALVSDFDKVMLEGSIEVRP